MKRLLLAAACAISASVLLATPALATHFQPESYAELLAQLHRREIVALVLHPTGPRAHASVRNGQHFTVLYTPAEVTPLRAAARAGGASFTIATAKPKAPVHHKLRYIAGGVLIVVILVVLVVLLLGRRRALEEEGSHGEAAASPPTGSG
jgi:hypothetical protein